MGLIIIAIALGLSIALPVKCHNDGQYKMKCLEMRGKLGFHGDEVTCDLRPESGEAK